MDNQRWTAHPRSTSIAPQGAARRTGSLHRSRLLKTRSLPWATMRLDRLVRAGIVKPGPEDYGPHASPGRVPDHTQVFSRCRLKATDPTIDVSRVIRLNMWNGILQPCVVSSAFASRNIPRNFHRQISLWTFGLFEDVLNFDLGGIDGQEDQHSILSQADRAMEVFSCVPKKQPCQDR